MATDKAPPIAKKAATAKAPAAEKKAVKPAVKPAARKPVNATPEPAAGKPGKKPKMKVVRDFSIPQLEYQKIADIKEACLEAGLRVKRREVLRAGLKVLSGMNGAQIKRVIAGLAKTRIDNPKKP